MFAMVAGEGQAPSKQQISTPTPKSNQALVQIAYAAQNPTDGTWLNDFHVRSSINDIHPVQSFDGAAFGPEAVYGQ